MNSHGGPYTSASDNQRANVAEVQTWNSDDGGTGLQMVYCEDDFKYGGFIHSVATDHGFYITNFPQSDDSTIRFLSGMQVHISSTDMLNGPEGNYNLGVTFTSVNFYQVVFCF